MSLLEMLKKANNINETKVETENVKQLLVNDSERVDEYTAPVFLMDIDQRMCYALGMMAGIKGERTEPLYTKVLRFCCLPMSSEKTLQSMLQVNIGAIVDNFCGEFRNSSHHYLLLMDTYLLCQESGAEEYLDINGEFFSQLYLTDQDQRTLTYYMKLVLEKNIIQAVLQSTKLHYLRTVELLYYLQKAGGIAGSDNTLYIPIILEIDHEEQKRNVRIYFDQKKRIPRAEVYSEAGIERFYWESRYDELGVKLQDTIKSGLYPRMKVIVNYQTKLKGKSHETISDCYSVYEMVMKEALVYIRIFS